MRHVIPLGDRQSLLIPLETIYDTVTESDIPDDTGMEGDKINEKESGYAVPTRVPVSKFVRYVRGRQASGPDWFEEEFAVSIRCRTLIKQVRTRDTKALSKWNAPYIYVE